MRRGLPESNITAQLECSLREIRDTWGVTRAGIVPESWLEWGLGAEGGLVSTTPEANTVAAHGAVSTNSRRRSSKLGKLVNQGGHAAHTALLEQLRRRHTLRDRTTHLEGERPRPSPRLAQGAYKGQKPLHSFGQGRQTRFVSYLEQSSWA